MKKSIILAFVSLLAVGTVVAAPKKTELEPLMIELPSYEGEQFIYSADPRLEVIGAICRLAGYKEFSLNYNGDNEFLSQVDGILAKYKDHKAVKQIKSYKNQKNISGSAWINLAYHMKPDFSGYLVSMDSYPAHLNPELKKLNKNQLNSMLELVHSFAADTNYARICILNNSKYIHQVGWFREQIEKFDIAIWAQDFFGLDGFSKIRLNVSYMCPGYWFWDYSTGANGERIATVTVFPGIDYYSLFNDIICLYTQDYANKNLDKVKENFEKYAKDFAKKANPDNAKEIEKQEINSADLALWMANVIYLNFCKHRAEVQTEEDIEKFWDFQQTYDSVYQYYEKVYGQAAVNTYNLLDEYAENRDKYPTIDDFSDKINEYINSVKVE